MTEPVRLVVNRVLKTPIFQQNASQTNISHSIPLIEYQPITIKNKKYHFVYAHISNGRIFSTFYSYYACDQFRVEDYINKRELEKALEILDRLPYSDDVTGTLERNKMRAEGYRYVLNEVRSDYEERLKEFEEELEPRRVDLFLLQ